jgi:hypothetical protein
MEFPVDAMEDEIIELEDILDVPETELQSADSDDTGGDDFAFALPCADAAVRSVMTERDDFLPGMPGLEDEAVGVEDEPEHELIFDEDMRPAGEFEGWPSEIEVREALGEPESKPGADREADRDGAAAFFEPPIFTVDTISVPEEENPPGRQGPCADNRDLERDDSTREMVDVPEPGVPQLAFLTLDEETHEVPKAAGGLPSAWPAEQTADAPPAGASLVLDGLIAQLETKLIINIQRLLESKMPGIVASVIEEELENLKKYVRRIENRDNDRP